MRFLGTIKCKHCCGTFMVQDFSFDKLIGRHYLRKTCYKLFFSYCLFWTFSCAGACSWILIDRSNLAFGFLRPKIGHYFWVVASIFLFTTLELLLGLDFEQFPMGDLIQGLTFLCGKFGFFECVYEFHVLLFWNCC